MTGDWKTGMGGRAGVGGRLMANKTKSITQRDNAFATARLTKCPKDWETAKKLKIKWLTCAMMQKMSLSPITLVTTNITPRNSGITYLNFGESLNPKAEKSASYKSIYRSKC